MGKTSLGQSIADALNRPYYKIALGAVKDEAEIRGHRRTYVGAHPGRIITTLRAAKKNNPVILFDEIDKMGRDQRGDPGSALLEVLDPNQNDKFVDNFLATPFDLSKIFFICTANTLDTLHPALVDRLEIIDLSGYSIQEKMNIAKKYLVPKVTTQNGLTTNLIQFPDSLIEHIITNYTMESGVRKLQQRLSDVTRYVAFLYASAKD